MMVSQAKRRPCLLLRPYVVPTQVSKRASAALSVLNATQCRDQSRGRVEPAATFALTGFRFHHTIPPLCSGPVASTRMASSHSTTAVTVQRAKSHLLRILGVGFGVAVIVGSTIGSGILRTPGEIAAQLGSQDWIIGLWLLGGLYAFFCTLSVVELGTSLPFAGGWYVFSRRAFGEYVSFAVGSSDWMMQMVASAYLAVAFGEFAAQLQPALQGYVKLLAAATLIVL